MRMTKTFSLDVKTIIKLKGCRNQSAVVERAVNKYLNEKEQFKLGDVPTRSILAALTSRDDCPSGIIALIADSLNRL